MLILFIVWQKYQESANNCREADCRGNWLHKQLTTKKYKPVKYYSMTIYFFNEYKTWYERKKVLMIIIPNRIIEHCNCIAINSQNKTRKHYKCCLPKYQLVDREHKQCNNILLSCKNENIVKELYGLWHFSIMLLFLLLLLIEITSCFVYCDIVDNSLAVGMWKRLSIDEERKWIFFLQIMRNTITSVSPRNPHKILNITKLV